MKIAMLGGSFNPVHNGHIQLAKAVRDEKGYDHLVIVPAFHSPFKKVPSGASDDDRLNMLHLAFDSFNWVSIENCELCRKGVSYTIDTVLYLTEKFNAEGMLSGKLGLVMGEDLIHDFPKWHNYPLLKEKVDLVEMPRTYESSTNVRQAINMHEDFRELVPLSVFNYIKQKGLYCDN